MSRFYRRNYLSLLCGWIFLFTAVPISSVSGIEPQTLPPRDASWHLVWADEFQQDGKPDPKHWQYEIGFLRNREVQWYQPDNAYCRDGCLILEARRDKKELPAGTQHRRDPAFRDRGSIEFTSASLVTPSDLCWTYGRFEMRGRFPTQEGLWPAWWTTGKGRWPHGGEIDMMEYYDHSILANVAWAGRHGVDRWDASKTPMEAFHDPLWHTKFHDWVMEWTPDQIRIWLDGKLLNQCDLRLTLNEDGPPKNPFHAPHQMRLNLALGGNRGGDPERANYPARFEVDWVRVYQQQPEPKLETKKK